ncbi:RHS repeat domain-containing protein, partial [Aquimarina spongiae]
FGNLSYVLPPKVTVANGVSQSELAELCYQYKYDYRNRLVEKKIPGKGWEYIVYNKLDQPVMTQDANLRSKNQWLFTKYDRHGRVAYTGLIGNSSGRIPMQESADNTVVYTQHESKQSSAQTIAGTTIYYSNNAIPQGIAEIHTINYYDDYNFDRHGMDKPATVYGVTTTDQVRSLPTGTKVRVLDTNNWITTVTAYDNKGRAIWIGNRNHYLSTIDKTSMKLDFTGRVEETTTSHVKNGSTPLITVDTFTYDHTGRLLTQTQKINDQDVELIVNNTYDELGQLVSKKVGGTSTTLSTQGTLSGAEGLQQVDYTYNIRGWLKTINDPNNLGDDLFAFGINYNTTTENLYASKLYNGNISETIWRTANDNTKRAYGYRYDALNRFVAATDNDNKYVVSSITYDKMGNIESLARNGWQNSASYGNMDVLAYDYDSGNKLIKVTDAGNKDYGFKDGTNTNDDFEYDANGNMIIDRNKGISSITYNYLNLPETVSISNSEGTGTIAYIYDATGAKQKKIVTEGSSITTEYAGNYVYKNGNLEFFNHPEGYIEKEADGYKYVYQFKDHLDNIRLSYKDANKDGAITQDEIVQEKNYYPFGLEHKGYNNTIVGQKYNYKQYQSQEFTEDLGLNTHEWKYRVSDPAIGRFWQIDPLAEDYVYNGTYNFAENRVIDGNELEGLEWTRFENPDGSTHYSVHYKVLNSTTQDSKYEMSSKEVKQNAELIKSQTESSFSGKDADGNNVTVSATYEIVDSVEDGDFYVDFVDKVGIKGIPSENTPIAFRLAEGKVDEIGNSESNRIQISSFMNTSEEDFATTGAHELGHTVGLSHQNDESNTRNPNPVIESMGRDNLMRSPQSSDKITPQQRSHMRQFIPRARTVSTIKPLGIVN